jgi:hypothetical protein
MLSFIKNMFKKKNKSDSPLDDLLEDMDMSDITDPKDISEVFVDFSYDKIPDPVIYGNVDSKKTFLIMDDLEDVFFLYNFDFKNIKSTFGIDVLEEFKIVKCSGVDCGFMAHKYLSNCQDDLVIALLDITIGKLIKLEDGDTITFDGVDIALEIINSFPKCEFKFCTAHRLNKKNPEILPFINKFEENTGLDIADYYFSKNSNRVEYIYEMLLSVK